MIKYRVISSFVFLRFFAPAILGPKLFEIHSEPQVSHRFIIYEEQHNKGHIYRTIFHKCHNKIVCPLGNL